jgi:hypothetical protein
MGLLARSIFSILILSICAPAQLPSSRCDQSGKTLEDCPYVTRADSNSADTLGAELTGILTADAPASGGPGAEGSNAFVSASRSAKPERFHWGRALFESFMFLSIEQAYVVHDDYHWVIVENGAPLNHYWRDYKQSLSSWIHSGWNDGDPLMYGYLGHPIQGAMTEYIQIQNDPRGRDLELSNTREYWHSRFRAFLWNAVYSTQWNIGPISELTFEKYGTKARPGWNQDGSWPCTRRPCLTGAGQIDLVMTPIGGSAWVLGEDFLDKTIARRVEGATQNHFLIDFTRCALNPIRGGANILHGKAPWYRASRDAKRLYFSRHAQSAPVEVSEPGERR